MWKGTLQASFFSCYDETDEARNVYITFNVKRRDEPELEIDQW